jgi:ClpP class serine protease
MKLVELLNAPWAILPETLREIHAIYQAHLKGESVDIAAVEARLGRPLANEQQRYQVREGGVAVLPVEGVIAPKANLFTEISGGTSAQIVTEQLQALKADNRVKAVVQLVDSPGGSVLGIPEWAAAVRDLAAVKPVVTLSDGLMASAGIWGGSAANAMYLTGPTVQAGSIGIYARMALSQADPGSIEFVRGKYKRGSINGSAPSADYMAYFEAGLDYLYSLFVETFASHRGLNAETVLEKMADGRLFIGQQAIDAGLVDGFASLDELVEKLATNPNAYATRSKAKVFATAAPAAPAPAQEQTPHQPNSDEGKTTMDVEKLKAEHGAVYAAVLALGATQERERILAVQACLIPGHEALVERLMFDGKTSGGEAALQVNAAERAIRVKQGAKEDEEAPPPAASAPAPSVDASAQAKAKVEAARVDALPVDERCKAKWEANTDSVRSDFTSLQAYTAYTKAVEAGKVKQLHKAA